MKQIQTKYEAPKVELIEMELQGILCASAPEPTPEPDPVGFNGTGIQFGRDANGYWN